MRFIYLFLAFLFSLNIYSQTQIEECKGDNCTNTKYRVIETEYKKEKVGASEGGSLLFDRGNTKYKKTKTKQFQLKLSDIKEGLCLVGDKKGSFYKIVSFDSSSKKIYMVEEKILDPNVLKQKYYFFDSRDFNRDLEIISCKNTPRLNDSSYVNNCIKKNRVGTYFCEEDRVRY
ncbi:MAG: hypothetical protein GY909_15450 [Oligoflexia bacterium]|nr:hypothetical protein [Oligoflexia bacterium]